MGRSRELMTMAKLEYTAVDETLEQMSALQDGVRRKVIKEVVAAGAEKYAELLKNEIVAKHHVVSWSMHDNVRAGRYYETVGGGYTYVYPQGADGRGIDNAKKAFIINNGRFGGKTGDRFITKLQKNAADPVQAAMAAKFDECMKEYTR